MRLIIKDYLLQLKEKDELDLLLCDLLFQMGYITDNKPESGNRQYGVDICAHSKYEVFLCVVKQGNLDRKNWDSGPNAVRQSLNEIIDVYTGMITEKEKDKLLHIVVATNGMMDEAVRPNWEGYKKTLQNNSNIKIDFWNLDKLVNEIQIHLFNERLFSGEMQRLLRRALYFIEESDYPNKYFEQIIDLYIDQLSEKDSAKERKKKISGLYLAAQMVAQYAAEANIYKISIRVSEYLTIRYWKYLLDYNKLGERSYSEWLLKFLSTYKKWNQKYYEAVSYCCEQPNRLPHYNPVEDRVILYELLGYLTTYAYFLSFFSEYDTNSKKTCQQVHNSIISLINNYPQLIYAPYDCHIGIISMVYRFLDRMGQSEDIHTLLQRQCTYLMWYYLKYNKYPTPTDSFEDAVNIDMGFPHEEYSTSAFWGTMLEWIVLMKEGDLYQRLQEFLQVDLAEVTKCAWFLRLEEESKFYDSHAMNMAGDGVAFEIEKTFDQLSENIQFIMNQYNNEKFSFEEFSFEALEFIVCRYYGYIVRVQRENSIQN